jgi:hypothetical protein
VLPSVAGEHEPEAAIWGTPPTHVHEAVPVSLSQLTGPPLGVPSRLQTPLQEV